ncbi:MAG: DUF2239 family protein [Caulobacterales bacterium]|nr:DUF2239 family protein [Caulobacterales bacterium]MCA0372613.1 DUF2239 family protein [Pseudomonadota bacterium]
MNTSITQQASAFIGHKLLKTGPLIEVVLAMKEEAAKDKFAQILCILDETGSMVDFDLSGTNEQVIAKLLANNAPKAIDKKEDEITHTPKSGRPKLGVTAKEVTLLPRHWEWLAAQRGGVSATLRRLVELAAKESISIEARKNAQNSTYSFLQNIAGDFENYEEVLRAIFADDFEKMRKLMQNWPKDIRNYAQKLFAISIEPTKD